MSRPRTIMRKIREVLRLRLVERLSPRQISAALGSLRITVRRHFERAAEKGVSWPLHSMDDRTRCAGRGAALGQLVDPTIGRSDGFQYTWFTNFSGSTGQSRVLRKGFRGHAQRAPRSPPAPTASHCRLRRPDQIASAITTAAMMAANHSSQNIAFGGP